MSVIGRGLGVPKTTTMPLFDSLEIYSDGGSTAPETVSSLEDLIDYRARCRTKMDDSVNNHYLHKAKTAPCTLLMPSIPKAKDCDVWIDLINECYEFGGSIHEVYSMSSKNCIKVIYYVMYTSLFYNRPCSKVSLSSVLKVDSFIADFVKEHSEFDGNSCFFNTFLTELDLSDNKLRDKDLSKIISQLFRANVVTNLVLDNNVIGQNTIKALCNWLQSPQCSLRKLSLARCALTTLGPGSSSDALTPMESLASTLGHFPGCPLQHLDISIIFAPMGQEQKDVIFAMFRRSQYLKSIVFDGLMDLKTEDATYLAQLVSSAPKMTHLSLANCRVDNNFLGLFGSSFDGKKLLSLNIANNDRIFSLASLYNLIHCGLKSLNLSNCKRIQSTDIIYFLAHAARSVTLKTLIMTNSTVTAEQFIVFLLHCQLVWKFDGQKGIRHIDFSDNPVGARGHQYLASVFANESLEHSFKYIKLRNCYGGPHWPKEIYKRALVDTNIKQLVVDRIVTEDSDTTDEDFVNGDQLFFSHAENMSSSLRYATVFALTKRIPQANGEVRLHSIVPLDIIQYVCEFLVYLKYRKITVV